MEKSVFEMPHYMEINIKRADWLSTLLNSMDNGKLNTAIDVGCGQGYFSNLLHQRGIDVIGFDGRDANIEVAKQNYPMINFVMEDIESHSCLSLGSFDLILCLGLLYHLENPFNAIRNLFALTKQILIIETRAIASKWPMAIFYEEVSSEDQGLNFTALIPSVRCLVKMLYKSGFENVYRIKILPDHPDFKKSFSRKQVRVCMVASRSPLDLQELQIVPDKDYEQNYWVRWWLFYYLKIKRAAGRMLKYKSKTN